MIAFASMLMSALTGEMRADIPSAIVLAIDFMVLCWFVVRLAASMMSSTDFGFWIQINPKTNPQFPFNVKIPFVMSRSSVRIRPAALVCDFEKSAISGIRENFHIPE